MSINCTCCGKPTTHPYQGKVSAFDGTGSMHEPKGAYCIACWHGALECALYLAAVPISPIKPIVKAVASFAPFYPDGPPVGQQWIQDYNKALAKLECEINGKNACFKGL